MTGSGLVETEDHRSGRIFNPGLMQTDSTIIKQFVVRQRELGIVLEVLGDSLDSPSCQHILIVASRGQGKTMLFARIAAELRTSPELLQRALPIRFMEESPEIHNLADFWLETLFHFARECADSDPEVARDLRLRHVALSSRLRDENLSGRARAAVLEAADHLGRKLVLMVENLNTLYQDADEDFGWQLRAVLQMDPQIILLTSATNRFAELDDLEEPFYGFFRIVDLKPLDTEACSLLWQAVGNARCRHVAIRPIEILTGGNPRLLAIIAQSSRYRSLRRLMEDLITLIDRRTEYFRSQLEALPRSERRVFIALIDLWQSSSAGDIAARARLDIRVVSTMLGRLIARGIVVIQSTENSRKRLYTAAEPLSSICFKLRRERDEAVIVHNLIRFMVAFYDMFELPDLLDRLRDETIASKTIGIDRMRTGRQESDASCLSAKPRLIEHVAGPVGGVPRPAALLQLDKQFNAAFINKDWAGLVQAGDRCVAARRQLTPSNMDDQERGYTACIKCEAYIRLGDFAKVIAIGTKILDRFRGCRELVTLYWSARVFLLVANAHFQLEQFEETVCCVKELDAWFGGIKEESFQEIVASALVVQADAERELANFDAAVARLDSCAERFGQNDNLEVQRIVITALAEKARCLHRHMNDPEAALAVCNEAIGRYGGSEAPEHQASIVNVLLDRAFMQANLGDFESEIESYGEVFDRTQEDWLQNRSWTAAWALGFKAMRQVETCRTGQALASCMTLENRLDKTSHTERAWSEWQIKYVRSMASLVGRNYAAADIFRPADEPDRLDNLIYIRNAIRFSLNSIALGVPESAILKVITDCGDPSRTLAPLIAALRQRCGQTVQAPAEVLGVAEDILKRIEEKAVRGILMAF